jgi:hypothetical protein
MSIMEYSGDFGGIAGGCHEDRERKVDSRARRRVVRGVRCVWMSDGEGSRVKRRRPELISLPCGRA